MISDLRNLKGVRAFSQLAQGHVVSQFIGAFLSIYVAKLYVPEDFGVFSVFMSLMLLMTMLNTLRLESLIVLEQSYENKNGICLFLLSIVVIITVVVLLVSLCIFQFKSVIFGLSKTIWVIMLFSAMLKGFLLVLNYQFIVDEQYRLIKQSKILLTILKYGFQILFFYIGYINQGLYLGVFLSVLISFVFQILFLKIKLDVFDLKSKLKLLKRRKNLLIFGFTGDFIMALSSSIIPILFIQFFGKKMTGTYFLAITILSITTYFCNSVLAPLYFKKASSLFNNKRYDYLWIFTKRTLLLSTFIISLGMFSLYFLIEILVDYFLDDQWIDTIDFVKIYVLFYIPVCVYGVVSNLEEILEKNHISLIANVFMLLVTLGMIQFFNTSLSIYQIVFMIALSQALSYSILIIYFRNRLKSKI